MTKRIAMLATLALFAGASTACFGLFTREDPAPSTSSTDPCAGLTGAARADCESRSGSGR
ncbi:MAG TPA: hypothetical protein VIS07_08375 [Candidatus Binatia bacterium]